MCEIKRIYIDLDGPLLDGKARHYHCYRSILDKFSFEPIGIVEYWESKRELVNRRDLLRRSGAEQIYDIFLASWLAMIESPEALALDVVQQGAVECLRVWKKLGIELVLVTMRREKKCLEEQLELMELRRFLDAVLVCDHADGGEGKANAVRRRYPEEEFVNHALWIGDTEADWQAAKSLGCGVVLVSNGLRNEAYLKSLQGAIVKPSISSLKNSLFGEVNVN